MSAKMDAGTSYNINTTAESSKEEDRKQVLGMLFLYGLGAVIVIVLGLI